MPTELVYRSDQDKEWSNGDYITQGELNIMENGIKNATTVINKLINQIEYDASTSTLIIKDMEQMPNAADAPQTPETSV